MQYSYLHVILIVFNPMQKKFDPAYPQLSSNLALNLGLHADLSAILEGLGYWIHGTHLIQLSYKQLTAVFDSHIYLLCLRKVESGPHCLQEVLSCQRRGLYMKEADRTEHMLPMVQHAHKATHEGEWTRWQFWSNQAELYTIRGKCWWGHLMQAI